MYHDNEYEDKIILTYTDYAPISWLFTKFEFGCAKK